MKKRATLLIILLIILLYGTIVQAEDFSISKAQATINIGETIDLDISGTDKAAVWTSYNTNIAKVNQKGEVTALKAGKATIRVRAGLKFKTCQVTVVNASIKLNKASAVLYCGGNAGGAVQLKATVKGTSKNVSWKSSDETVAVVDGNGKVTAISSGAAVITATANGMTADCDITVRESRISLNPRTVNLNVKGNVTIKPVVVGATNKVVWTTSNKAVATVSNGKITGKQEGNAVITATANGLSDTINVVVGSNVVTNETLTNIVEETVYLRTKGNNKTYTLSTEVFGATNKVTWTTSNKNVATVSNGKITANKAGTAVITATANGKSDTVNVIVEDFVPTIQLNQTQCTLYTKKGNTASLKATVDGNSKVVTWKSSDTSVVTVNKGKLVAGAAGIATIEATANGVTATCNVTVLETEVDLSSTQLKFAVGESTSILADVTGISSSVKWASTVSKVATVKNGVITAKNVGQTDIKATANGVTAVCHVIVAEKCNHDYDDGVIRKQGTCVSVGSVEYTCKLCGSNYNEPTNIVAHQYRETVIEPTCEEHGYTLHVCVVCGDEYTDSETDALGHKMIEGTVVPATCSSVGSITYVCDVCGKSETEELPMTEHSYGSWVVVKEATSTTEGIRQRICTVCNSIDEETIPVIPEGHVHDYKKNVKEATCTEDGYIEYVCSCGDSYKETILAEGHKQGEWTVIKKATCDSMGTEAVKCEVCGEVLDTRDIPMTEHDAGDWVITKEATCTDTGIKTKTCSICGKDVDIEVIPTTEHNPGEWTVVTEANCFAEGLEKISCTICGQTIDTRTIEAKQHSYYTEYASSPTCTQDGVEEKVCMYCGDRQRTTTPALGHDFVAGEVIAPTCDAEGYTEYRCRRCDDTEKRDVKEKLQHQPSEWHTISEANCVSGEVQGIDCTLCGAIIESQTLDGFGDHSDEVYRVIDPTPCEGGYTIFQCKFCRRTENGDYTPATGSGKHEYDYDNYIVQSETWILVPCKNCSSKKVYTSMDELLSAITDMENDKKAVAKVTEIIKQIITDDMTDAEKVFAVNNWICRNCEYDEEAFKWVMQNGGLLFSCDVTEARGVMLNGKAVCSGYSKAFKEFMDQLGIDCRIVSSDFMNHSWNQVRLDDGWYWLDVTWNDDKNKNGFFFTSYFLLTDKRVYNYQTVDDETGGEECSGTKYLKGAPIFENYLAESEEDILNVYKLQKNNLEIYIRDKNNYAFNSAFSAIQKDYKAEFNETLISPYMNLNDGTEVICLNNTENLKKFFEGRIAASETLAEETVNKQSNDDSIVEEPENIVSDEVENKETEEETEEAINTVSDDICSDESFDENTTEEMETTEDNEEINVEEKAELSEIA